MATPAQPTAFRINAPRIAHQTLDDETIIIDFDNGAYFSTNGTGAAIWQQIAQNGSADSIIRALTARYSGDPDAIGPAVGQFLIRLQQESLIVPLGNAAVVSSVSAPPNPKEAVRSPFEPPSLDKYTDMQDLLLLDAIHDVDEQGWPVKAESAAE